MDLPSNRALFRSDAWHQPGGGARYLQFFHHIARMIHEGRLLEGESLPSERDLAALANVSRVTIRRAVHELVEAGLVEPKRGSGSFIKGVAPRTKQSLSSLVSFTENMRTRGRTATSKILNRGLFAPLPDEMMALGRSPNQRVARLKRLRFADGVPMALEISSIPSDVLPDPDVVSTSLYAALQLYGVAPSRAIQKVGAINAPREQAQLLGVSENTALLQISRTAFLNNGRPIEYTQGLYRPDIYDFVTEIRPDDSS